MDTVVAGSHIGRLTVAMVAAKPGLKTVVAGKGRFGGGAPDVRQRRGDGKRSPVQRDSRPARRRRRPARMRQGG